MTSRVNEPYAPTNRNVIGSTETSTSSVNQDNDIKTPYYETTTMQPRSRVIFFRDLNVDRFSNVSKLPSRIFNVSSKYFKLNLV